MFLQLLVQNTEQFNQLFLNASQNLSHAVSDKESGDTSHDIVLL